MIGNDIVDLNLACINSRWKEQRFLDKLFTKEEQTFILKDKLRHQNIWMLWSMKESAHKIHARSLTSSIFNPKIYCCEMISETTGMVSFEGKTVFTTTNCNLNLIYTTAYGQDTLKISEYAVLEGISQKGKSELIIDKAVQAFAELKSISKASISVEKNNFGVPRFLVNNDIQPIALSLTHHGQYGGFAISY